MNIILDTIISPDASIEAINSLMDGLDSIKTSADTWLSIGKTVGLMCSYVYIFRKFSTKILTGEAFGLQDIAYPIFISFLLTIYTPLAKGIETMFIGDGFLSEQSMKAAKNFQSQKEKMNTEEAKSRSKAVKGAGGAEETKSNEFANKYSGKMDAGTSGESSVKEVTQFSDVNTLDNSSGLMGVIVDWLISYITSIIGFLCTIIIFFVAKLYLIFLYIFGPFSIAISLIPAFENSAANWFQKYISYSLWVPVGKTITTIFVGMSVDGGGAMFQVLYAALMIFSFTCIPKITSNIIAVGGNQSGTRELVKQGAKLAMGI